MTSLAPPIRTDNKLRPRIGAAAEPAAVAPGPFGPATQSAVVSRLRDEMLAVLAAMLPLAASTALIIAFFASGIGGA